MNWLKKLILSLTLISAPALAKGKLPSCAPFIPAGDIVEQSDKHILVKEVKEGVITLTWIWAINPGQPPRGITPVTVCSFKGMTFHIFNKKIKVGTHKA